MKKIILITAIVCLHAICFSQIKNKVKDGIYLVNTIVTDTTLTVQPHNNQAFVRFNQLFLESAPDSAQGLLINTENFVPLELAEQPELIGQPDQKKKLQILFSRVAADKLQAFTAANSMKQVTLVVDGQALTVHKIRAAITGGRMEISRCSDNACEQIYVRLKENVKQ